MLYHLHEFQYAAWAPLRVMAEATRQLHRHPMLPLAYTTYGRRVAAACELFQRSTWRPDKPAFGLERTIIDGDEVAVQEEAVLEKPFGTLLHFRRDIRRDDPRVLVVAPLSGHFATLLRGTVAGLLPAHDVYITDWANARDVPLACGRFDLDDNIAYIMEMLRHLGRDTHVIAVCQPSVPVLAAISLMAATGDPESPRSMVLMGGPIDTRVNPTEVNRHAETRSLAWFERSLITTVPFLYPGIMRRVYPGFIQLTGFMAMNLERHVGAHLQLFEHLVEGDGEGAAAHRRFYDEYLSVMDLPAEFFLQTVETVFQEHALPRGRMTWRGAAVEPRAISRTALMTVEGALDDISGVGQTQAAHELCTGLATDRRRHYEQPGVGHYGIFNGRRWRADILPRIQDFIRAQADA
jgi:poly(3-hydroxybutyrate) depolymerase